MTNLKLVSDNEVVEEVTTTTDENIEAGSDTERAYQAGVSDFLDNIGKIVGSSIRNGSSFEDEAKKVAKQLSERNPFG